MRYTVEQNRPGMERYAIVSESGKVVGWANDRTAAEQTAAMYIRESRRREALGQQWDPGEEIAPANPAAST